MFNGTVIDFLKQPQFRGRYAIALAEFRHCIEERQPDGLVTWYTCHNESWMLDFMRSMAAHTYGAVAVYAVSNEGDVYRLFNDDTHSDAFDAFINVDPYTFFMEEYPMEKVTEENLLPKRQLTWIERYYEEH